MIATAYRCLVVLLLLGGSAAAHPARAETFNTCAGFIDSVPATVATQGVWCLRKDLSTAITNGNAITIATNNVTIGCNDSSSADWPPAMVRTPTVSTPPTGRMPPCATATYAGSTTA